MRSGRLCVPALVAAVTLALLGCGSEEAPAPSAPPPAAQPPAEQSEAMEPMRERPPEPEPPREPEPEEVLRGARVLAQTRRLGRHVFFGTEVLRAPWEVPGLSPEPGVEAVQALGGTLRRCRSYSLERGGSATWCPRVGLVSWRRRERSCTSRSACWRCGTGRPPGADTPCSALYLITDEERASLCERSIRSMGGGPRMRDGSCAWRFRLDGRGSEGGVAAEARLDPAGAQVEERPGAWVARSERWAASVHIDRRRCGAASGAALAARLLSLAPDEMPRSQP